MAVLGSTSYTLLPELVLMSSMVFFLSQFFLALMTMVNSVSKKSSQLVQDTAVSSTLDSEHHVLCFFKWNSVLNCSVSSLVLLN